MAFIRERREWDDVLDFWFPEGRALNVEASAHHAHWSSRMQGGADDEIMARFAYLTRGAARGRLDHWAMSPHGRLALIVVLDQFSRSLRRDDARAFAQDPRALSLVAEGLSNGQYTTLGRPDFRLSLACHSAIAKGPTICSVSNLQRLDLLIGLRVDIAAAAPTYLRPICSRLADQARDVQKIIAAFGRHPHRNEIANRESTAAEATYIAKGQSPHMRAFR